MKIKSKESQSKKKIITSFKGSSLPLRRGGGEDSLVNPKDQPPEGLIPLLKKDL